ncbi:cytochrome P450 [Geodermatophilus bullaregiensis]|nr:cytochrome P450 [Geodermatophilus bullaregiensis]
MARTQKTYGNLVYLKVRGLDVYMVSGEEEVSSVLIRDARSYTLDRLSRGLADALGESLLVSDGPTWQARRRAILPAFSRAHAARYDHAMVDACDSALGEWPECGHVNLSAWTAGLSLRILLNTVMGLPNLADADLIASNLDVLMRHALGIGGTGIRIPPEVPTPANQRAHRAMVELQHMLTPSLEALDSSSDYGLAALLRAHFSEESETESARRMIDELLTTVLVGHETVALALGYACWLLAKHEDVQEEVARELRRTVEAEEIGALCGDVATPLLDAAIKESLRMFPPVWAMGREAIRPTMLAGYKIEAGAQVLVPVWVLHHREDWYPHPASFRPQRWLNGDLAGVPAAGFMPFGLGTRRCIGERLALREIRLVLGAVVRRYELLSLAPPDLMPSITLRTRRPIHLLVQRR